VYDGNDWRKGYVLDSALGIGACYSGSNRDLKKSEVDGKWYLCDLDSLSWVETHRLNSYFAKYTPDDKAAFLNDTIISDTMIDSRDKHVYRTVKIPFRRGAKVDTLIWMAENLNYEPKPGENAYGQSWCYDDLDYNCEIAGRLYSWVGAMNMPSEYLNAFVTAEYELDMYGGTLQKTDEANPTVENLWEHQGICPEGWTIPDYLEYVDDVTTYGENVKTTFEGAWGKASNEAGFSAIPSGYRTAEGKYVGAGAAFVMWTFYNDEDAAKATPIFINDTDAFNDDAISKKVGAAVRCVKYK